jgi:hypothetical protein
VPRGRGFPSLEAVIEESRRSAGRREDKAAITIEALDELRSHVGGGIRRAQTRLEAFHEFSLLESQFEPIESCVGELASRIDQAIQLEIDIRRGK